METLFHTSPAEITTVNADGLFDSFLFFSSRPYSMSTGKVVTYSIELADSDIISAGSLFYHADAAKLDGLVAAFCKRFDIDDTDDAEEIISERKSLCDVTGADFDGDDQWAVQLFAADCAKALGFRDVAVTDESGTAYMIDMLGRESDLRKA